MVVVVSPLRRVPLREILTVKNLQSRGIPREYCHADVNDYELDKALDKLFRNYLENIEVMHRDNISLILYGANGNGKTWLSSLIIKEAYIYRFRAFRVTLQEFIDMQFEKHKDDTREKIESIHNSDFLVIDEVGKETFAKNQFNIIVLEELMRQRERVGRPTIICTNLPLEGESGVYAQYGNSVKSLVNGNYLPIEFNSLDNRRDVTKSKEGLKLLLGGNT